MRALGVTPRTPRAIAVFAAIRSLADADKLPGVADYRAKLAPGYAYVRRVAGQNLWIWYRFDDAHVDMITLRSEPPVPSDD